MDDTSVSERQPELEKVCRHVRILVELGRAAGNTADFLLVAADFGWREGVVRTRAAALTRSLKQPTPHWKGAPSWQQTSPAKDICRA